MSIVRVALEPSYDVHVVDRGFAAIGPLVRAVATSRLRRHEPDRRAALRATLTDALAASDVVATILEVPDGEARKDLDGWRGLVEALLAAGVDRKSAVLALGGGVVGDLAGFAAATVLRGVPLVQVPTSLLAMVDSSVGGKTGVNAAGGKNLVGAFHQPRLVYAALDTLDTLPARELRSGLGEVVKHGLVRDPELFELLERNAEDAIARRPGVVRELVERSVRVKAAVIAADEREQGVRTILNFGHTVGPCARGSRRARGAFARGMRRARHARGDALGGRPRGLRGRGAGADPGAARTPRDAHRGPSGRPESARNGRRHRQEGRAWYSRNRCARARRMGAPRADPRGEGRDRPDAGLAGTDNGGVKMDAKTLTAIGLLLVAAPGCKAGDVHASPDDTIIVNPETITIQGGSYGAVPDESQPFYQVDGTGKLWYIEFAVLDENLDPRNGISVDVDSLFEGLAIIPPSAVRTVDPPELPDDVSNRGDIVDACTDDDGNYTNDEEWCAYYYDVDSGTFIDFGSDYAYSEGYVPTYAEVETDGDGVARVYLFLDWIPNSGDAYSALETDVIGSIGYFVCRVPAELRRGGQGRVSKLPGRDALEAELLNPAPPRPSSVLEPKVVPWDHRRPPEKAKPPPTIGDRLRALFARR